VCHRSTLDVPAAVDEMAAPDQHPDTYRAWQYINIILTDSQIFVPIMDLVRRTRPSADQTVACYLVPWHLGQTMLMILECAHNTDVRTVHAGRGVQRDVKASYFAHRYACMIRPRNLVASCHAALFGPRLG